MPLAASGLTTPDDNGNNRRDAKESHGRSAGLAATAKCALVTGAAAGLGREIAILLAKRGCSVGLLDINREGAEETARLCADAGGKTMVIVDDLTRDGAADEAVQAVANAWGGSTSWSTMPAMA